MPTRDQAMVPISRVCTRLTELVEDVAAGTEKVLPKYGSPEVALIDARKADYSHAFEVEYGRSPLSKRNPSDKSPRLDDAIPLRSRYVFSVREWPRHPAMQRPKLRGRCRADSA